MSLLKIYRDKDAREISMSSDHQTISNTLNGIGVLFEQWQASQPLAGDASNEAILSAYSSSIDRLNEMYGFQSADVVALTPDHPDRIALRKKFIDEHTHSDFEVRFFVGGKGLFYIHHGDKVYAVLCEQGDLISVPANTKHWFDMGAAPDFRCIRLFTTPEGWEANYTDSDIARSFPTFDETLQAAA